MSKAKDFVHYLNEASTPIHAVLECKRRLVKCGFVELDEKETNWQLEKGKKYYYTRNGTALIAFVVGGKYDEKSGGCLMIGAHTDSPCPRLKPISKLEKNSHIMLGVVGYGGGLWHTWFDRDLTVGGRVLVRMEGERIESRAVRIDKPICRISNLAIHLLTSDERHGNQGFKPNLQNHLPPILATGIKDALWKDVLIDDVAGKRFHPLLVKLCADNLQIPPENIIDLELQLCDTQPACIGGACDEFIFSGRLDNQACCYLGLEALCDLVKSNEKVNSMKSISLLALFDHEEVGSLSATGAQGPLLHDAIQRISTSLIMTPNIHPSCAATALRARSLLVSADMAHAAHPNYSERHDPEHAPKLGKGLVIKHNANQRYATDAIGATLLRQAAAFAGLTPCQEFAVKADCACGSTIGPISAAALGVRTIDVGAPQLSMHSIREMMHIDDLQHSFDVFSALFWHFDQLQSNVLHSS
uniref:aspartyl aminopeptidase n=1 Tax=Aureoumbra lagunensis TaxID=44058 RepID=A0A7S3NKJ0_9STRA|mmetsp:Transcript_17127/g.22228  ORF Transcript_17127/g.22228 Transcript_17127/m.22228 type:complete len:472 (-) Transcript_17127:214-1629(-)